MADLTVLSLCSGIGGLDLGVSIATGGRSRVVGYVEREAFAAQLLVDLQETGALDPAPVWCGNLEELDPAPFLGVDLVTAGIPCQPFSVAGKRGGLADERWIWPAVATLLGQIRPRWLFLENVAGFVQHGLGPVLRDLAALGYDAEWDLFRASDVSAPHRRERIFLLANAARDHAGERPGIWPVRNERDHARGGGEAMADTQDADGRRTSGTNDPRRRNPEAGGHRRVLEVPEWPPGPDSPDWGPILERWPELAPAVVANARHGQLPQPGRGPEGRDGTRPAGTDGGDVDKSTGARRGGDGRPGPGPTIRDEARSGESGGRRGNAEGDATEPGIRGVAHGVPDRVDRLRALGNAVVPQQAALAFATLYRRFVT